MTRKFSTELFGKPVTYEYAEHWVGYSILLTRIVIGWVFLQAGLEKLFDPNWTAAGYLANAIQPGNPFIGFFGSLAGNVVVDWLVIWGLTLIGIALILGVAVRFAAFWGVVVMLLFWASHLYGGLLTGFRVEHGWFVTEHIVYSVLLFGLAAVGAGKILGVDGWLENKGIYKKHEWLRNVLQ